jgi:competence protein ComEA
VNRSSALIAVAGLVLAGAAGLWFGKPAPAVAPPETAQRVVVRDTVTVHVSGAVAHPGLVEVQPPARVADAIVAAGGALPSAALGGVNLAAPISDGQHIEIPSGTTVSAGSGSGKVALNSADVQELQRLPGVGPVLAQRIFEYREQNGPFQTIEDLLDVSGIGESKLAALREAVTVP